MHVLPAKVSNLGAVPGAAKSGEFLSVENQPPAEFVGLAAGALNKHSRLEDRGAAATAAVPLLSASSQRSGGASQSGAPAGSSAGLKAEELQAIYNLRVAVARLESEDTGQRETIKALEGKLNEIAKLKASVIENMKYSHVHFFLQVRHAVHQKHTEPPPACPITCLTSHADEVR